MSDANKEKNTPITRAMLISAIISLQTKFFKIPQEEALQKTIKALREPYTPEEADEAVQFATDHKLLTPEEAANKLNETVTLSELTDIMNKLAPLLMDGFEAFAAMEGMEQTNTKLPPLPSIVPKQHIMVNNPVMNYLTGASGNKPIINAGAFDVPVIPATKGRDEITTYVMVTNELEKEIVSSMSELERDVSNALMSIWEQALQDGVPAVFTADSLYRAMPGSSGRASAKQEADYTKAVEKFRHLFCNIDATEELRHRKILNDGEFFRVNDYYLSAKEGLYIAKGGQVVKAWRMNNEPLILEYAKQTGQIITVAAKHLDIKKVKKDPQSKKDIISDEPIAMSAKRQGMTSYMLRRIGVMQHDHKRATNALRSYNNRRKRSENLHKEDEAIELLEPKSLAAFREKSDTILFDTLFKATDNVSTNREVTRRNRDFCFDVLDFWKLSGFIRDYEIQRKGKKITGVIIKH